MKLYHASPCFFCNKDGIKHNHGKTCCNFDDGFVYLGSIEYLEEQYFKYCPKGIYYIFEVDVCESDLEFLGHVKHYRHSGDIDPSFVEPYGVRVVK